MICDFDECKDACGMTDLPVWLRPYWCRHLTDEDRRIRRIVFAERVESPPTDLPQYAGPANRPIGADDSQD